MTKTQYILVADSSSARVYQADDTRFTDLKLVAHQSSPGSGMTRAAAGSETPKHSGGTHGLGGDESAQLQETASFAKEIAHWLQSEHQSGKFAGLSVIAPPHFLGDLRQNLSSDCTKVLGKTVNKNLLHEGEDAIIAHLS